MHLPVGTLLQGGRYEIIRYISSGGFGCTYEARDTKFKSRVKSVAIKEFFVNDFCNRDADSNTVVVATNSKVELVNKLRVKFLEEADALFELEHPNIVRVTDTFEENGTAYYVMEYISGTTLAAIVDKEGSLSEDKALGYIRQVADALKYVHSHKRSHFDVKPQNIMIDCNDRAVLIDFGISKQYDEVNGVNTSTLVGYTPGYAPLELSYNDITEFSPTTDIYSLGATLFNLVTGTVPPSASRVNEDGLPVPVDVSAQVFNVIKAAMQPRRKDRPQNIDEFLCLVESGNVKGENGKMKTASKREGENLFTHTASESSLDEVKDESDGETVLNGNVKGASKREGENLFTHTASESSFDEVKGENGKLVADESQSIDVVEVPDSADTVISNEGEKSHSADAVILNDSEKSQFANNEILRSAQNDNSANSRQNDKDGNEEVERRNEKEHSAGAVISNESEKSQKNKPGKSLWLILLLLLLVAVAGAWFLFGGAGNGDVPKRDTKKQELKEEAPTPSKGKEQEQPVVQDNSFKTLEFTVNGVSFKMVAVEGGTFQMGATSEQQNPYSDEKPVHDVTLSSYYIGETEVTQALWEAVMGSNPSCFKGSDNPVECVSYNDCVAFVKKLNEKLKASGQLPADREFRLPTEAEWEFAARGGNSSQGYRYSGSNTFSSVAWYWDNGNETTHPVKEKHANELGLYDMSGNVWEWCYDSYSDYPTLPQTNPKVDNGPGSNRVTRGGGWNNDAQCCRVAYRSYNSPGGRFNGSGLRLAL